MRLWLDLETFSTVDIRAGTHAYAEAAEVMLWAFAVDDDPVAVWDVTAGEPMPLDLLVALLTADEVWAHNSHFDRTILRHCFPDVCPAIPRWRDTMVQALSHSLPGALDALGDVMGLRADQAKNKSGKRLIQLFCKPLQKRSKLRRATRETHPEEWAEFVQYAGDDITAMRALHRKMPTWNYPDNPTELALWHQDQAINDRGITLDVELIDAAIRAVADEQEALAERAQELTGGVLTSATRRDAMLKYLADEAGMFVEDLKGSTVERLLESGDLPPGMRELLTVRLQATTSSTAKYRAMRKAVSSDNRVRGLLQFCGASRTGRWAGRMVQPQNFTRGVLKKGDMADAIAAVKNGTL